MDDLEIGIFDYSPGQESIAEGRAEQPGHLNLAGILNPNFLNFQ
jgi:hypothetical protein